MQRKTISKAAAWLVLLAVGLGTSAGCGIAPTTPMKQNGAVITDTLGLAVEHGLGICDERLAAAYRAALVNESILGSPEERIPIPTVNTLDAPDNSEAALKEVRAGASAVKANADQAEQDKKEGGTWTMLGSTTLDLVAMGLGVLGLGGAGSWVKKRKADLKKAQKTSDEWQAKAEGYRGKFETTVKGVQSYLDKADPGQAEELLKSVSKKASEAVEPKAVFDAAVDAVIKG